MATAAPERKHALSEDDLERLDRYWRAANYLAVGQIYLLDNPLLRHPLTLEHVKPRLLGHWGTTPGLNFVYVHLNRVISERDLDMIYICGPGHGGPAMVANTYLEGSYSELYSHVPENEEGMKQLFKQFSFPGGVPSHAAPDVPGLDPRGRRARLRDLARLRRRVRQPRPGRRLRDRRRRGRVGPAGDVVALEQVPQPRHRRRRAADPAPERLQDREPDAARPDRARGAREPARRATATSRTSSRAPSRPPCTAQMADDARHGHGRDPGDPARGPRERRRRAAALADDRPAHAEGLDRPEGGRRQEDRGLLALAPGAALRARREARAPRRCSRSGCGATSRRSSSTRTAGSSPTCASSRRRATAAWARTRTRTAASCSATCACRTSATTPSTCRRRPRRAHEATRALGSFLRDVMKRERGRAQLPRLRARRARVEPPGRALRGDEPALDVGAAAGGRPPRAGRARLRDPQRAHLPGLARGLPADRTARHLHDVRGLRPHRRLDVQPAREVAEGDAQRDPVAPPDRVAQLPPHLARVAPGPQRLLAPGSRLHRPRRQQEGRGDRRLPAARRQHAALRHGHRAPRPQHGQRRHRRQAAAAPVPRHGRRGQALHDGDRHLGVGVERPRLRPGRRDGVLRRRADDGDAGGRRPAAHPLPRPQGARRQRRRPDACCSPRPSTRTGCRTPSSTASSPRTSRSSSPSTATRGSSTASRTGARTTRTSTCAATRRRGRRRRRSTWSSATTSTASTSRWTRSTGCRSWAATAPTRSRSSSIS